MTDEARAAERRPMTWLWMVLALVCVAGFLSWLGLASEPSSVAIVEDSAAAAADAAADGAVIVPKDTLAADKARYEGQRIRVPSIEATGSLGAAVFWGELGTQSRQVPILVRLDSALVAQGVQVATGSRYSVTGTVNRMSDSIVAMWGETGVLTDEGARMQATFADFFIEASNIRPAAAGGSEGAQAPAAQPAPQG